LGNTSPTRDFNFVSDTVEGFILAASAAAALGRTINLGSGREISISELVDLIGRLMNKPVRIEEDDDRIRPDGSEVDRLLADNQLARELLGWEPRVDLVDGLQRTIDWIEQSSERFHPGVYVV
jgi:dTDP-glucose 4,6-dehydratase